MKQGRNGQTETAMAEAAEAADSAEAGKKPKDITDSNLSDGINLAGVVELVDTQVSKTCALQWACRFDSDRRHYFFYKGE